MHCVVSCNIRTLQTTVSNTERMNAACIILEQLLNKSLLYLSCGHHIYKLVLRFIIELKMSNFSGGLDVELF